MSVVWEMSAADALVVHRVTVSGADPKTRAAPDWRLEGYTRQV